MTTQHIRPLTGNTPRVVFEDLFPDGDGVGSGRDGVEKGRRATSYMLQRATEELRPAAAPRFLGVPTSGDLFLLSWGLHHIPHARTLRYKVLRGVDEG